MVHIEHGSLRALAEDFLIVGDGLPEQGLRVVRELEQRLADSQQILEHRFKRRQVLAVKVFQEFAFFAVVGGELLAQAGGISKVADADADARDLVRVRGADAPAGGADLLENCPRTRGFCPRCCGKEG